MAAMRKWISLVPFFAAPAVLSAGFALANQWLAALGVLVTALAGRVAGRLIGRNTRLLLPSLMLVIYVGWAAGGVLARVSPALMIAGAALALAAWELSRHPSGAAARPDYRLLGICVGLGLLLAEGGLLLQLSIPFFGMVAAALLVLFSLYRFYCLFRRPFDEKK